MDRVLFRCQQIFRSSTFPGVRNISAPFSMAARRKIERDRDPANNAIQREKNIDLETSTNEALYKASKKYKND